MTKMLYIDGRSGVSGDMAVAALLDLGVDRPKLLAALASLGLDGYRTEISRVRKNEIEACDFNVILEAEEAPGRRPGHEHHHHGHGGHHHHGQDDHHHHHHHHHDDDDHHHHHHHHRHHHHHHHAPGHQHRNLGDIRALIDRSALTVRARELAKSIFQIVAEAEAEAHGLPLEKVHFHEVGAVDSIVDIVAAAFCLDELDITETVVESLSEGRGEVLCQHGRLPVPVPAVVNIAAAHQLPLTITDNEGEMITPTGAAIVAAVRTRGRLPEKFVIQKVGLGAGKREFKRPNILRVMLIEDAVSEADDRVWVLETNIDDCSGEALAFTLEALFQHGAKDAFFTPIFMKKSRPAQLLRVICADGDREALERIIFTHTSTIGLRRHRAERTCLPREIVTLETEWGRARVKKVVFEGQVRCHPEYEDVKRISQEHGLPFPEVYAALKMAAEPGD